MKVNECLEANLSHSGILFVYTANAKLRFEEERLLRIETGTKNSLYRL